MYDNYRIRKGDTLKSISNMFNVDLNKLKSINNIYYENDIREGMDIIVPKKARDYFTYYTVEKGDTLYQIGRKYNINPELLMALNGLNKNDYIYDGQEILIPKSGYSYYITKEGDTIDLVIDKFKTNKNNFYEINEVIYLMPGQLLVNKQR